VRKPAHRAGADPGQQDTGLPGLAHDRVDAVLAPDRQQVAHRATADVDDVLREDQLAQVVGVLLEAKQREVQRTARAVAEGRPERRDLAVGIAAGSRQEEDPRLQARGEREDEVVQCGVVGLGGEAPSSHGEDPARSGVH